MSDAELSDVVDEDDIVRRHERDDEDDGDEDTEMVQDVNVSGDEVKDDGDENKDSQKVDPPKKKKIVRKLFVLNTERLKSRKGVHTIEKLYKDFKFKGKGHEKEDLDRVMKRLEYWAFRLFPKLDFDDFLAKCEHLGHKKELQVYLKRYRLNMITADYMDLNNDIIEEEEEEEKNDDPAIARTESELLAQITNDDFQRLFDETERAAEPTS